MQWALVFLIVWFALVLLFCVFKIFGGRLVDVCKCGCFSGPCFDCWATGGVIEKYDTEYPPFLQSPDDYGPYGRRQGRLPPIVVVNSVKDDDRNDDDDDDDDNDAVDPLKPRSLDPELRPEAGGALLLRAQKSARRGDEPLEPVVV